MNRVAVSARPVVEDTFVPELEEEEARLERLLSAAKDEAARRIREAETAAEKRLDGVRESLSSETAEEKRKLIEAARESLRIASEEARAAGERLERDARKRIPQAVDALIAHVLKETETR